jgi:hypothetical protein
MCDATPNDVCCMLYALCRVLFAVCCMLYAICCVVTDTDYLHRLRPSLFHFLQYPSAPSEAQCCAV